MKTCKDCLHYKVCELKRNHYYLGSPIDEIDEAEIGCHNFTDISEWVHLPSNDYTFRIRGDIAKGIIIANCRAASNAEPETCK